MIPRFDSTRGRVSVLSIRLSGSTTPFEIRVVDEMRVGKKNLSDILTYRNRKARYFAIRSDLDMGRGLTIVRMLYMRELRLEL